MEKESENVYIVCINDFHGEMDEEGQSPGAAKLMTALQEFREQHKNALVLFGGDNYKGNPVTEYMEGRPVSDLLCSMEIKASALGNHEFDFGMERICQWQKDGRFSFLACNLIDNRTGKIPDFIRGYQIFSIAGRKILIVGLALPERLDTADRPAEMKNYHILNNRETIRQIHSIRKETEGKVDAIIALTHYGLRYKKGTMEPVGEALIEVCHLAPYLDGIFAAHLHQFMAAYIGKTAVAQGGSYGRGFAWLKLVFRGAKVVCVIPGFEDLRMRQEAICPNKEIQKLWKKYKDTAMEKLGRTLAVLKAPVCHRNDKFEVDPQGTPLSYMATELMRQITGCPISLFYSGRIGTGFREGKLSLYDAEKIFFFDNEIVIATVKGSVIRKNVETGLCTLAGDNRSPIAISGLKVVADFREKLGHRIVEITLENGDPLEMETEYEIAMDEFLADSQMGFDFTEAKNVVHTEILLKQRMIEKIASDGSIALSFPRAIKRRDEEKE